LEGKTIRTTTTETHTVTSVPHGAQSDDVITQAVKILQASCDMLDETADRIAVSLVLVVRDNLNFQRQKLLSGQNVAVSFPSENRQKKTTA
jgi:hypothetical protein